MTRAGAWPVALIGALALVWGCATSGKRFDPDSVVRIERGRTTQAQVQRTFGTPVTVRTTGSGRSMWRYDYHEEIHRDTGMLSRIGVFIAVLLGRRPIYSPVNVAYHNEIRHKLDVTFDANGVVYDYIYERTEKPSKRVY